MKPNYKPIMMNGEMVRAILDGGKTQTRRPVDLSKLILGCGEVGLENDHVVKIKRNPCDRKEFLVWYQTGEEGVYMGDECVPIKSPFGVPGDRLYVRENFKYFERRESDQVLKADESKDYKNGAGFAKLCERLRHEGEDYLVYMADQTARSFAEWDHSHEIYEHCIGKFDKTIPSIHMPKWASRITLEVARVWVERVQEISHDDAELEGIDIHDVIGLNGVVEQVYTVGDLSESNPECVFRDLWDSIYSTKPGKAWADNPWVWCCEFEVMKSTTNKGDTDEE